MPKLSFVTCKRKFVRINTVMGDHFMGVSGLRVAYGRWGDDLDYMVNKYHAPEYVVWMNEVIAEVGKVKGLACDPHGGDARPSERPCRLP